MWEQLRQLSERKTRWLSPKWRKSDKQYVYFGRNTTSFRRSSWQGWEKILWGTCGFNKYMYTHDIGAYCGVLENQTRRYQIITEAVRSTKASNGILCQIYLVYREIEEKLKWKCLTAAPRVSPYLCTLAKILPLWATNEKITSCSQQLAAWSSFKVRYLLLYRIFADIWLQGKNRFGILNRNRPTRWSDMRFDLAVGWNMQRYLMYLYFWSLF